MNFDSSIKSPINDALDILINLNPKHFATLNDPIKLQKYRNQFLVVLQERLINQKTLKQCAEILNKSQERTRQIEAKLIRILRTKMNSKSKLILNKKIDKREKQNLDLDSRKANKELGWKSFLTINDTLKFTAAW